jgi:hypothetical protein
LRQGLKFTDIEGGFPHSEILGSKLVRSSPRLIAAYHVLHRLLAPRHPPDTLIALDCSHYRCPPSTHVLGRGGGGLPSLLRDQQDTTFKDQLLLRTYPGTERSSLPTAGVHDLIPGQSDPSTNAHHHQTRDHPDMFPLHDVLEPAEAACRLLALHHCLQRNLFMDEAAASAIDRGSPKVWWSLTGSNRRPHACKARALPTELRPLLENSLDENGGPGKTRTSDLTLIKRAL